MHFNVISWIRYVIVFWTSQPHFIYLVHSRAELQSKLCSPYSTEDNLYSKHWRLDPVCLWHMAASVIHATLTRNNITYYYTSDSLWKIWLVENIQSIHNSLWTWHDKCNTCCRYCIYHIKFNVCLVTKPLGVFSSETEWLNVFFCLLFKKCIIKQLLNSVFARISWIIKTSCRYYLPKPKAEADNTDLGFDNSWYHAQPHPIIV